MPFFQIEVCHKWYIQHYDKSHKVLIPRHIYRYLFRNLQKNGKNVNIGYENSLRHVGRVCMGVEPWELFMLMEQVTWTKSGGMSGWKSSPSSRESPSRMLKESWSWLTVLVSDAVESSPSVCEVAPPSWSSYSTTRSVSLSVITLETNTFSIWFKRKEKHTSCWCGWIWQFQNKWNKASIDGA